MKSSRMLLLLAVTVMSTINATNNPDIAMVMEVVVNQQKRSLVRELVLQCNDPALEAQVKEELSLMQDVECETDLCRQFKKFAEKAKKEKNEFVEELDKAESDTVKLDVDLDTAEYGRIIFISVVPVQE